jgi:hypothetical protein
MPDGGSVFVAESGAGRPVPLLHGHGAAHGRWMSGRSPSAVHGAQSRVLADGHRDGRLEVFIRAGHVLPLERAASVTAAIVGLANEPDAAASQASPVQA